MKRSRKEEIDEELQFHLASAEADLKKDGVQDARRTARLRFGNPASVRDAIVLNWVENTWWDVRLAVRSLVKSKAMTAVIIASLALGIGANTAIFSLVHGLLLKTLPVRAPEQLYAVGIAGGGVGGIDMFVFSNPLWEAFREQQKVFESALAWASTEFDLNEAGVKRPLRGAWVSSGGFRTLGIEAALGRLFTEADDGAVAVLGYDYWKSTYGANVAVIGNTLRLNGKPFEIIGVASPGFHGIRVGERADVMVPLEQSDYVLGGESLRQERQSWWLTVVGRLPAGGSATQANARLAALSRALMLSTLPAGEDARGQADYLKSRLTLKPLVADQTYAQRELRTPALVLAGVVALVLLMACVNVASLLVARAASRARETAVRVALGASSGRLLRQHLTESLLLALSGAALGLALAPMAARALVRAASPERLQFFVDTRPDATVLAFTCAVAVACGVAFGLAPGWRATRVRLTSRASAGDGRLRGVLVAAQVALTVVVVTAAGLFLTTFRNLAGSTLGFRPDGVLMVTLDLNRSGIAEQARGELTRRFVEEARRTPGVVAAGAARMTPLSRTISQTALTVTQPDGTPRRINSWLNDVGPGYFQALGTPLLAGRDISGTEREAAVVNEAFARLAYGGANPVGRMVSRRIFQEGQAPLVISATIVGLVPDAKYLSVRAEAPPTIYFPLTQQPVAPATVHVALRSATRAEALLEPLAGIARRVDARICYTPATFASQVREAMRVETLLAALSAAFGALALALAAMGLYGVLAYTVARQRAEIGVRIALGATPARICNWVMRRVGVMLISGAVVGVGVSIWATRFARSLLFGVEANDARVYAGGLAILLGVAALAAYWPARRAARVDPLDALRCE